LSPAMQSYMAMLYNVGAILGAIVFGQFSDRLGRRVTMIMALVLALIVIPFWAFGTSLVVLAIAAFLMQAGVQGAWGVIPVHLSELSADATRGLVPGLAYQLGILIAAPTNTVEFMLREHVGYQWALAGFEIVTISVLIVTIALGKERKGRSFHKPAVAVGVE
jgi:SHS family lactate transporter-like MFS transporter